MCYLDVIFLNRVHTFQTAETETDETTRSGEESVSCYKLILIAFRLVWVRSQILIHYFEAYTFSFSVVHFLMTTAPLAHILDRIV